MKIEEIKIGGKYKVMTHFKREPIVEVLEIEGDIVHFKYTKEIDCVSQLTDTCHGAWLREVD